MSDKPENRRSRDRGRGPAKNAVVCWLADDGYSELMAANPGYCGFQFVRVRKSDLTS
jgi:hypothetical protein